MIVWLNGALHDESKAKLDLRDRGLLLGDGLFETLLARRGRVALLEEHIGRLRAGASLLGIPFPHDTRSLGMACGAVLEANGMTQQADRAALRITLTRGPGPRGLALPAKPTPTLMISANPSPAPASSQTAALVTLRRNAHSPTSRLKVLSYLDNILARQEAQAKGADEALLLDTMGFLSCASVANIFLWEGERLITPSEDCAILPGVTRAVVIELARSLSLEVAEERISVERLAKASGGFLTNSLIGLQPLTRIDGRNMHVHRLTGRLAAAYDVLLDAADEEEDEPIRRS